MKKALLANYLLCISLLTITQSVSLAAYPGAHRRISFDDIIHAIKHNNYDYLSHVFSQGYDINIPIDEDGRTFLRLAIDRDAVSAALALLDAGANPDIPTLDGKTSLYRAVEIGLCTLVKELLAYKADPNRSMLDGSTPLMGAAASGNADCVSVLIAFGADAKIGNNQGVTACDLAQNEETSTRLQETREQALARLPQILLIHHKIKHIKDFLCLKNIVFFFSH